MSKNQLTVILVIFMIEISVSLKSKQSNDVFTDWRIGQKSSLRGNGAFAENIKCEKDNDVEEFTGVVTLPNGFGTVPVFNEASNVNPSVSDECIIKQLEIGGNQFAVKIFNFDTCGVQTQKGTDGALWMSVSIRFPLIGSLRTANDEVITLMCKPKDRVIIRNHVLDLKSQFVNPLRTVFSSSPLDFECNLEVYVKSDDNSFTRMTTNEELIEVGNDIQLRASIRSGDGWKYAMLKDVTVHKVLPLSTNKNIQSFTAFSSLSPLKTDPEPSASNVKKYVPLLPNSIRDKIKAPNHRYGRHGLDRKKREIPDAAFLVLSDGCRNPVYRSIASRHPAQESEDNMAVSFNFKAFMFQDMSESGTIRITAKVMACVDEEDCRPTRCLDDDNYGYGRRRKRSLNSDFTNNSINNSEITDFSKEIKLKVVMPSLRTAFVRSDVQPFINELFTSLDQMDCQYIIYLIGTLALVFSFGITTASTVIINRLKRNKELV